MAQKGAFWQERRFKDWRWGGGVVIGEQVIWGSKGVCMRELAMCILETFEKHTFIYRIPAANIGS